MKVTAAGRAFARGSKEERQKVLRQVVSACAPYSAIVERAAHRTQDDAVNALDIAAHWHDHFNGEVGQADATLNDQAICFLNLVQGAGLGSLVLGRKGNPTRFDWDRAAVAAFAGGTAPEKVDHEDEDADEVDEPSSDGSSGDAIDRAERPSREPPASKEPTLGQAIFLAHGKNKTALEQLKKILAQFNIPFKVAVDEPNLGRPISSKVRETMQLCNCAILVFTADEKFIDKDQNDVWRPSENVVYELGACSYLYGDRVVVIKEDKVLFPSNFRDVGYISFSDAGLDAKALDIIKELIGFGIVKITT